MAAFCGSGENVPIEIRKSYADFKNAILDTEFVTLVGGVPGTNTKTFTNVAVIDGGSTADGNFGTINHYTTHTSLADDENYNYGDDHSDWAFDAAGNLVIDWEKYGFNNN